ncbi:hypothetical protein DENSPDRAFT_838339 [Dentipellis sp. KUC8613]|nr:hypothetical protein DENSPDRAFT_838339 [Dentipellis sp. KUC8613]
MLHSRPHSPFLLLTTTRLQPRFVHQSSNCSSLRYLDILVGSVHNNTPRSLILSGMITNEAGIDGHEAFAVYGRMGE